jgi:hypothetical protein
MLRPPSAAEAFSRWNADANRTMIVSPSTAEGLAVFQ